MTPDYDNTPVFYFGTGVLIDIHVYYKTAFGQTYKRVFKHPRRFTDLDFWYNKKERFQNFANHIVVEASSSDKINSVSDISQTYTLDGTVHPDETLTDGKLEIGGKSFSFSSCKETDTHVRS